MKHIARFGILGAVLLSSSLAAAAPDDTGFEVGLRTGYSIALGTSSRDTDLNDVVSGTIPIWLDLGYRITPNVMVGLYGSYGFGFVGSNAIGCDQSGVDCNVHNIRFGGQVHYHFTPDRSTDPWIGAGFGYEWLSQSVSASVLGNSFDLSGTVHGFEFINLQGGLDFKPSDSSNFGIGPFIAFSLAEYASGSASCSGSVCGQLDLNAGSDIGDKSVHEWLTLGVRGTFVP
jgi:hypothetical protein